MRIFITGGTGAIGRILVPRLVESGHEVTLLARPPRVREVERWGAVPVVADPLDRSALTGAVQDARPDVVVHQLTALSAGVTNFRRFPKAFALTNRFRTEVTDTLLAAARLAGARRFIAQSFCGWPFARTGGPVKTEQDPLDPDPPAVFRGVLAAIRHLEDAVRNAEGIEALALRYGLFYGPGTSMSRKGGVTEAVAKRRLPIVGDGGGVWSFLHIADAAGATEAAITRGDPGIYNVVDDEPAPVATWLPFLAQALGAGPPRRVPVWLARLLIGEGGVSMMTQVRGGSNAKARGVLAWEPTFPTWRRGFVEGLG